MRIGLNLLHMHDGIGGVWNYVANLISALSTWDDQNDYVCFVTGRSECLIPDKANFQKILISRNPENTLQRVIFENTFLHLYVWKHRLDCLHWFANVVSPFSIVPSLVTIHDLLPLRHPDAYSKPKQIYLKMMLRITARKAKAILPVSEATAADIQKVLQPKIDIIHVLPIVLNQCFGPAKDTDKDAFKKKYNLPDSFWLYVANFYPHKNHIRLIKAYAKLKETGNAWPLVLRGNFGADTGKMEIEIKDEIRKNSLDDYIIWLPRLSSSEMGTLFSSAGALVFPSLFEGGGIPVVEAMACGCAVAASDIQVIREFTAGKILFFNPEKVSDVSDAMEKLQNAAGLRDELIKSGYKRATFFSGERVARKLVTAYEEAIR